MGLAGGSRRNLEPSRGRATSWLICILLAVVLLAAGALGFRRAGRWLVREDPLARADVIVVLSGGLPDRGEEAARIFSLGQAPEVWVSRPQSPALELQDLGIRYVGEEDYNREILLHSGVPEAAVQILPDNIVDTEQELREVAQLMRRTGKGKAIIVTSPEHTRRVKALWRTLIGETPEAIVHATPDSFDADHWWRNTRDAFAVVREYLGLLNVWAGLPVRPHST